MALAADITTPVAWWKEPSREQWPRLDRGVARLGPGCIRFHDFPADHGADRQGLRRAAGRGHGGVHDHLVDAAPRRYCLWLARRSGRAQAPADDLDRLVLGSQPARRAGAEFLAAVPVPRCSASPWAAAPGGAVCVRRRAATLLVHR